MRTIQGAGKPAIINVVEKAMRRAARVLVRDFGEVEKLQVSRKGPADFVSAADRRAEEILREELARGRPRFGMMLEERGSIAGADENNRWIVDPLDGTTNFLHGLPHFAISVAHEREGEIVAGAVLDPIRDEFFWAEKGAGAWLNDQRLRASGRGVLAQALIATGLPFKGHAPEPAYLATLEELMAQVAGIRRFGSAALDLAYVAAGRYEGFWEFGLQPWDIAAGIILVREAGGMVSNIAGRGDPLTTGNILAANEPLHSELERNLRRVLRAAG